jgi:uncharacterized membrane protein (DUF485 family)
MPRPTEAGPGEPSETRGPARTRAAPAPTPADFAAIARTDAYRRLTARRRRFTLVASGAFYALFAGFVALAAWGPDWMAERVVDGLTVGYLLALAVIAAVWAVVFAYSRTALRELDPLAAEAQENRRR